MNAGWNKENPSDFPGRPTGPGPKSSRMHTQIFNELLKLAIEAGGMSGIVIDNNAAGAQNIYFSTLLNQMCTTSGGTGGCGIQTVQSAP